jgi:hypothetical protein
MKQEQFIGCDAHKEYSVFVTLGPHGMDGQVKRVGHELESMRNFLSDLPSGTPIALEAGGTYYWLVQEMERAGHHRGWRTRWSAGGGWVRKRKPM